MIDIQEVVSRWSVMLGENACWSVAGVSRAAIERENDENHLPGES